MRRSAFVLVRRLLARLRRDRLDAELNEEIQHHLELRRRQLIDAGLDRQAADIEARRRFGNIAAIREQSFAWWSVAFVDDLSRDLRYGGRMLVKSWMFSAIAVVSLAAGIGASTVLFSFVNAWLFRPLPAANPAEIVQLFTSDFDGPRFGGSSYPDYEDFARRTGAFAGLLASTHGQVTLSDADRPDIVDGEIVSPSYFDVLGLRPSGGRLFHASDGPLADAVVVLSHEAWERRFGADPQVVGRTVGLNGHRVNVIGVGPPGFSGINIERAAEFFLPAAMQTVASIGPDLTHDRRARAFRVFGRLGAGKSTTGAEVALQAVAAQLLLEDPDAWRDASGRGRIVTVLPERDARFAGNPEALTWILSSTAVAVSLLLGVACVNVATMLLARATTRRREIAVRLAIGASRARVVQQLLTECALLAGAGGVLGFLLARWTTALFTRFRPDGVPPFDLSLDYRLLAFGIAVSFLTVVLFGLAPALQTTRPDVNAELKGRARRIKTRRFSWGLRDALVVLQIALSLTLVVGAALLVRSAHIGRSEDPGFRRDGILNVGIDLSTVASARHASFYRESVRSVGGLPGVDRVTLATLVPMSGSNRQIRMSIDRDGSREPVSPDINIVGPGYFSMMGIRLMQGREFLDGDREGAPRVAVVNEMMARRFWNGDAIGRVLWDDDVHASVQVVGIVRDLQHRSFDEAPRPMAYFSADQDYTPRMTLHVSSAAPLAELGTTVVRALHEIDPAAAIGVPQTMVEHMDTVTMPQRAGGLAAAATGALELALGVMALYGVIVFAAAQRTREVAIRLALGATPGSVTRLIVRDGLALAVAGAALGIACAMGAAQVMTSLLIGVTPTDPVSVLGSTAAVLAVAVIASYLPARQVVRVNPTIALRCE
ncbi:MAG TPA: ABC transporter permease [Vicinamibacterales bacterium]|nr:ABC transporter permease [Vicinamibacterales bacterium]